MLIIITIRIIIRSTNDNVPKTASGSAIIAYEGTEVSLPISSLSQEDILEDISTYKKDVSGSIDTNSDQSDIEDNSVDCEQNTEPAKG